MLKEYMQSLAEIKKLTRDEEAALWRQYKGEGRLDARQKLIENYQLLVCREAVRYPVQETLVLDLIQEGMVGLMEAAERFSPQQGVAFSLFAVHRVRGRMLDFLKKNSRELPFETSEEGNSSAFSSLIAPDLAFEWTDRTLVRSIVSCAMERLPEKERRIPQNVFLEEQSAAETADQMAVSTTYVYRLEKRGIRRLRGMLSHWLKEKK